MRARALVAAVAVAAALAPSAALAAGGDPVPTFGVNGRLDVPSTATPPVASLVGTDDGLYLSHGAPGTVSALAGAPAVTCLTACRVEPLGPRTAVLVDGDSVRSLPGGTLLVQRPGTTIARITALGSGPGFVVEHGTDPARRTLAVVPPSGTPYDLLDETGQPAPAGVVATLPFTRFALASARTVPGGGAATDGELAVRWYGRGDRPETLRPAVRRAYPGRTVEVLAAAGTAAGGLEVLVGSRPSTENADGWPLAVEVVRIDGGGVVTGAVPLLTRKWSPSVVTMGNRGVALVGTSVHTAVSDPPAEAWVTRVLLDPPAVVVDRSVAALGVVDAAVAGLDGDLVLSGSTTPAPRTDVTVVHVLEGGTDDPAFGTSGVVTIALDQPTAVPTVLALLGDGSIVAAASQATSVVLHARGAAVVPLGASGPAYPWQSDVPAAFTPMAPNRLLDTRVTGGRLEAGEARPVDVRALVPAEAVAAAVTVTAVDVDGPGFARFVAGDPTPTTSTLNFSRSGETVANTTIVHLGAESTVPLLSSTGAHYVIDVTGYWVPAVEARGGRLHPLTSARLLDTRDGAGPLAAGTTLDLPVAGHGGVPTDGVSAVVLTLTTVDAASPGFVTVWPDGERPTASTLNPAGGDIRSNIALVPVDARGHVLVYTHGPTDLVVDVQGWFTDPTAPLFAGGLFVGQPSRRALDTRETDEATLPAGSERTVDLAVGHDLTAVVNVTAADTPSGGFITAYPWQEPLPLASAVNVDGVGQNRASMAFVRTVLGRISLYSNVPMPTVVDVLGWFTPAG